MLGVDLTFAYCETGLPAYKNINDTFDITFRDRPANITTCQLSHVLIINVMSEK